MKSFHLMFCALLAAIEFSAAGQSSRALPRRSNVILIVADGLGAGDLSCYGQTQFQTPNLDKLAAEGIRFTHYSAASAKNSSAQAALLLGKKKSGTDVTLDAGDTTIATLLKDSGYFTALIGEWELGDQNSAGAPWLQGFDDFGGYFSASDAANAYADFVWRYEPDPLHKGTAKFTGPLEIYVNTGGKKGQYIPDFLATASMNIAKQHRPEPFTDYRPFFLMVDYTIPGNGDREVPTDAPFSEQSWPQPEKNRAAMIARIDGYIGQMLEQLDKFNQASNTVVFFTSDTVPQKANGTDPKFFHENPSRDSLIVPLIVRWPGKIPAGQVSDQKCSASDFLPTAAAIGFVTSTNHIEGVSLLPTLLDRAKK